MIAPLSKKAKSAIYFAAACALAIGSHFLFNWFDDTGIYYLSDTVKKVISYILFVIVILTAGGAHNEWVKTRKQWKKWNK